MSKKKIYIWCCDKNKNTGEGVLANKFINDVRFYNRGVKLVIKSPNIKKSTSIIKRFIHPFEGLIYLWCVFIFKKNKDICYLNYLPLWNFFLILLLPPKTILGPITGGSLYSKKPLFNFFLRKYIIKFFIIISKIFIKLRTKKLLFSTDLLRKQMGNNKNYFFNYVLKDFKIIKNKEKKIYDLIFYLRDHKNKDTNLQIKIAKQLAKDYKIVTVGKKIDNKEIKNLGIISRVKLIKILKKTKYTFISPENLYSFFAIDSVSSGTNVFFKKNYNYLGKSFKGIDYLNYENFYDLKESLQKILKKKFKHKVKYSVKKIKYYNYFKL